jgi:hypothetical protein
MRSVRAWFDSRTGNECVGSVWTGALGDRGPARPRRVVGPGSSWTRGRGPVRRWSGPWSKRWLDQRHVGPEIGPRARTSGLGPGFWTEPWSGSDSGLSTELVHSLTQAPVADRLGPGPGGPADLAGPRRAGPETRFDPSMLDQRSGGSRCARPAAGEPRRSRCRTGRSWPRNRMVANASVRRVMRLASRGWLRGVSPPSDLQIVASSDSAMPARRTEAARQPACILAVSPSEYVGRAQAA